MEEKVQLKNISRLYSKERRQGGFMMEQNLHRWNYEPDYYLEWYFDSVQEYKQNTPF